MDLAKLEKLARLHENGVLTNEEFEQEKANILGLPINVSTENPSADADDFLPLEEDGVRSEERTNAISSGSHHRGALFAIAILMTLAIGAFVWLIPSEDSAQPVIDLTAIGPANGRDRPTTVRSRIVTTFRQGAELTGRWVDGADGGADQWLEVEHEGEPVYVWSGNLSRPLAEAANSTAGRRTKNPSKFSVRSNVDELRVASISEIPENPTNAVGNPDDCKFDAVTQEAQQIRDRGWRVTGEAVRGPYAAVSFAGAVEWGLSGSCMVHDANLALFENGRVVAIVYGPGDITAVTAAPASHGNFRVYGGIKNYEIALGDISISGEQVDVSSLPAVDRFCQGNAQVPNVLGTEITIGRERLLEFGWRPVRSDESLDFRSEELSKMGVIEAQGCSGTGFGLCGFAYTNRNGNTLFVTTMGDEPQVSNLSVEC